MKRHTLLYGVTGGVLIVALKMLEYRFLVVEHSIEIYGGLVAALFAVLGIWLGQKLTKPREKLVVVEVPVAPPDRFVLKQRRLEELCITPRELEILGLIATGMSTGKSLKRYSSAKTPSRLTPAGFSTS